MSEPIEGKIIRKRGPKSKFDVSMCDTIKEIASTGGHIAEMRLALGGICKQTWCDWIEKHKEFREAVEEASLISQVFYERLGLEGVKGELRNFKTSTYEFIMRNKFKDEYKIENIPTEINITNNTVNLTSQEAKDKIEQKIEKLKSLGLLGE